MPRKGLSPLPAESTTVGVYLGVLESRGRLVPTIERTLQNAGAFIRTQMPFA